MELPTPTFPVSKFQKVARIVMNPYIFDEIIDGSLWLLRQLPLQESVVLLQLRSLEDVPFKFPGKNSGGLRENFMSQGVLNGMMI